MENFDLKDRKILYELDIDSRQSFSKIGKKVGLHRNNVLYRVDKLKEMGIIKKFYTFIDANKLGYTGFRVYLNYQYATPEIEKEIVDFCVRDKYTWWVISGSLHQNCQLSLLIWVKDINDFHVFWEKLLLKYRYYIKNHIVAIYLQLSEYELSFLCHKKSKSDRKKFDVSSGGKNISIDDIDYKILRLIASNARIPTIEIAKNLGLTAGPVNNRIKKLIKSGVIRGFRVDIDFSKIGYKLCKVDINLLDYKKRKYIINYVKSNPHFKYIAKSLGFVDLELGFIVENINQFNQILEDITIKFSKYIKDYNTYYSWINHKMVYMPEE